MRRRRWPRSGVLHILPGSVIPSPPPPDAATVRCPRHGGALGGQADGRFEPRLAARRWNNASRRCLAVGGSENSDHPISVARSWRGLGHLLEWYDVVVGYH